MLTHTIIAALGLTELAPKPVPVHIQKTERGFALSRGGKPFLIKGAGGNHSMKLLKEAGGNSTRTWGADDLGKVLDEAAKNGLTVTAGIWLLHASGLDYSDPKQVQAQKEKCRQVILQHKDHPALLMWAFGNEMEGFGDKTDPAIWRAIEDIAKMSKELDPNHPTMTVIAEIGGDRVASLNKYCPSLDAIGINSYGGGSSVVKRYREAGGTKPVVITEFGPLGSWEGGKSEWGAPFEATSTEKAAFYRETYTKSVIGRPDHCLGSYTFLWAHKVEATPTWFGMFLPDGTKLASVDTMTNLWSGKNPPNLCPTVEPIQSPTGLKFQAGAKAKFTYYASDPEKDPLKAEWVLKEELKPHPPGQDSPPPKVFPGAILDQGPDWVQIQMPSQPGPYRLYLTVRDGNGGGATANVPVLVEEKK